MADDHRRWITEVAETWEHRLLAYASRIVGRADLAQDVVQDVFLRLWQQDRDQVDSHLAAWLYRVCRNRALDVAAKERRMHPSAALLDDALSDSRPERPVEAADEHRRLLDHIDRLPPKQQEVLRLKFQGGLDHRAIAACLDTTPGYVARLLYRATSELRQQLTAAREGDGS